MASYEARIVTKNPLEGPDCEARYPRVPSVVFTLPAMARVGMLEEEATAQGLSFEVKYAETGEWYSARRVDESAVPHKILVEPETGRILGAHLLGPSAAEVINVFALAMDCGITAQVLRDAIFGHPTGASDIGTVLGRGRGRRILCETNAFRFPRSGGGCRAGFGMPPFDPPGGGGLQW